MISLLFSRAFLPCVVNGLLDSFALMKTETETEKSLKKMTHSIADHEGVLSVKPVPGKSAFEIEYDSSALSEDDLRQIAGSHMPDVSLQTRTMRLDGSACEACAIRLEKKRVKSPECARPRRPDIGKILCLTFDEKLADESSVMAALRGLGAQVRPYEQAVAESGQSLCSRIKSGSLNEEISAALGFVFFGCFVHLRKNAWHPRGAYTLPLRGGLHFLRPARRAFGDRVAARGEFWMSMCSWCSRRSVRP
jgi:hypothetical protein